MSRVHSCKLVLYVGGWQTLKAVCKQTSPANLLAPPNSGQEAQAKIAWLMVKTAVRMRAFCSVSYQRVRVFTVASRLQNGQTVPLHRQDVLAVVV